MKSSMKAAWRSTFSTSEAAALREPKRERSWSVACSKFWINWLMLFSARVPS
jgi:hypothetical protein